MAKGKRRQGVQRQTTRKFVSTKVQGRGSWISFHKPTWGEIREATTEIRENTRAMIQTGTGRVVPAEGFKVSDIEDTLSNFAWELAVESFSEWNWVDDDGEPLVELPALDINDLMGEEVDYIIDCVREMYMPDTRGPEGN
jgi:hypothetical protein